MQVSAFHALVSTMINLGTSQDALIPEMAARACEFIESNHTYLYMEKFRQVAVLKNATSLTLSPRTKEIIFMRRVDPETDVDYLYFVQIDAPEYSLKDFTGSGVPEAFWLDGNSGGDPKAIFNLPFDADATVELVEVVFTDWTALAPTAEPWLLKHAIGLMLYQTLAHMALALHDTDLSGMNMPLLAAALNSSLGVDEALRQSARVEVMHYGGSR